MKAFWYLYTILFLPGLIHKHRPENGRWQSHRNLHSVLRSDQVPQAPAHVTELGHVAALQHGAFQLLSLHLLLLLLDLLLQTPTAVLQLCQPALQLGHLLLRGF